MSSKKRAKLMTFRRRAYIGDSLVRIAVGEYLINNKIEKKYFNIITSNELMASLIKEWKLGIQILSKKSLSIHTLASLYEEKVYYEYVAYGFDVAKTYINNTLINFFCVKYPEANNNKKYADAMQHL